MGRNNWRRDSRRRDGARAIRRHFLVAPQVDKMKDDTHRPVTLVTRETRVSLVSPASRSFACSVYFKERRLAIVSILLI